MDGKDNAELSNDKFATLHLIKVYCGKKIKVRPAGSWLTWLLTPEGTESCSPFGSKMSSFLTTKFHNIKKCINGVYYSKIRDLGAISLLTTSFNSNLQKKII